MINVKNNKGLTLVELIVSFIIVSVATIYFFQTIQTISKIQSKIDNKTKEYVNKSYMFHIFNEYFSIENIEESGEDSSSTQDICDKIDFCYKARLGETLHENDDYVVKKLAIKAKNNEFYYLLVTIKKATLDNLIDDYDDNFYEDEDELDDWDDYQEIIEDEIDEDEEDFNLDDIIDGDETLTDDPEIDAEED